MKTIFRYTSISDFHRKMVLSRPEHPLISLVDISDLKPCDKEGWGDVALGFHVIACCKWNEVDGVEERLIFWKGDQNVTVSELKKFAEGKLLLIHPDLMARTKTGMLYDAFFKNAKFGLNEVKLTKKQVSTVQGIMNSIKSEYKNNIDVYTSVLLLSNLELLLKHWMRFTSSAGIR